MSTDHCNQNILTIIDQYLKYGWMSLKELYYTKKIAKERIPKIPVSSYLIDTIDSIRKFHIDLLFNCCNKDPKTKYLSYGSTTLGSDYDLTIIGKNAPEVVKCMLEILIKTTKMLCTYMYDTNIYCAGMYTIHGVRYYDQVHKVQNTDYVILVPTNHTEYKTSMTYAFTKLQPLFHLIKHTNLYLEYAKDASEILESNTNELIAMTKSVHQQYGNSLSPDIPNLHEMLARYLLMIEYANKLYNILYRSSGSQKDIIELACKTQYFSIESYYTPSTFNVVVIEIQSANKSLRLSPISYVCSIIENIGDMISHLRSSTMKEDKYLLNIAKYLYRINYSFFKLTNKQKYLTEADYINTHIIPLKKKQTLDKNDYSTLSLYMKGYTHIDFINSKVIEYINELDSHLYGSPSRSMKKTGSPSKFTEKSIDQTIPKLGQTIQPGGRRSRRRITSKTKK
jgi:hypothetical protein